VKRLMGLVVCMAALFGSASAAEATCFSSTPATATYADDPADSGGYAPEISTVTVSLDALCNYTVNPGIASLGEDDAVYIYIDSDGNPATGDDDGADEAVITEGSDRGKPAPVLVSWSGWRWYETTSFGPSTSPGGFTASVDRLQIAPGALTHVRVVTYAYDADFAPDEDAAALSLPAAFSTTPPPPTVLLPPPAPAVTPAAAKVPTVVSADSTCTVPNVKGKTRHAAEKLLLGRHCAVALSVVSRSSARVRKGLVIDSLPGKGTTTSKRVKLLISKGR
jgi:hypothetical protein